MVHKVRKVLLVVPGLKVRRVPHRYWHLLVQLVHRELKALQAQQDQLVLKEPRVTKELKEHKDLHQIKDIKLTSKNFLR